MLQMRREATTAAGVSARSGCVCSHVSWGAKVSLLLRQIIVAGCVTHNGQDRIRAFCGKERRRQDVEEGEYVEDERRDGEAEKLRALGHGECEVWFVDDLWKGYCGVEVLNDLLVSRSKMVGDALDARAERSSTLNRLRRGRIARSGNYPPLSEALRHQVEVRC